MLLGLFDADPEWADFFLIVATLVLWVVGAVSLYQDRPTWKQGVAWIGTGFIPFALLFFTTST